MFRVLGINLHWQVQLQILNFLNLHIAQLRRLLQLPQTHRQLIPLILDLQIPHFFSHRLQVPMTLHTETLLHRKLRVFRVC